ncbi:MAG: zinc-ribbon domain-containing protein [Gammaproteobacteria bacterium]|nr:zinc-ribbon domain-containing protein [Gammaproteobacteria bacterium]MDH5803231.1 zinc-ribbon domain-containing protein [Gammaproteobacteria bacterium]
MYTQCPQCLTYFQVTPEHLKIAQGNVRCGQCRTVFSALGNLTEEPPQIEEQYDDFDDDIFLDESELEQELFEASLHGQESSAKPTKLGQAIAAIQALNQNARQSKVTPAPAENKAPLPLIKNKKPKPEKKAEAPRPSPRLPSAEPAAKPLIDDDDINYDEALRALDELRFSDAMEQDQTFIHTSAPQQAPKQAPQQAPKPAPQKPPVPQETAQPAAAEPKPQPAPKPMPSKAATNAKQAEDFDGLDATNINLDIANLEATIVQKAATPNKAAPGAAATRLKTTNDEPEKSKKPANRGKKKRSNAFSKQILGDVSNATPRKRRGKQTAISWWGVGGVCLMMTFLLQTIYFKHNDLAKNQSLRPWISTFCKALSCDVKLPSDVKKLELIGQDIRSHPDVDSALKVSTTIINNAGYAQSYPLLQITFSDINGQRVAERQFKPKEYLPIDTKFDLGMAPDTPIKIELEMLDPGSQAVNFEFDFFPLLENG